MGAKALLSAELAAEAVRQLGEAPIPLPKRLESALKGIGPARAYSRELLDASMDCLGEALAYAGAACGEDLDAFLRDFAASGLAKRFGRGKARDIAVSGDEVFDEAERGFENRFLKSLFGEEAARNAAKGSAGVQLAKRILQWRGAGVRAWPKAPQGGYRQDGPPAYRAGWALAWYQWRRNEPLKDIIADAPLAGILRLVLPHRRAELAAFGQALDALRVPARDRREGGN